ncbi:peptidylprolyl isomerase [Photobacterium lucens]|uniref:peptidylprolyl isomerase n=1 Tax=Photobacterium lucens TaxID=2562949 RepID=UPI0006B61F49|nr:peptidylprolyl isomerase [Photobacterium lucens]KPA51494.1 cyclophilin [Photobacterium leiognathi subsp. mandapamensis]MZG58034.1 peptidyl-prolyl cis-trans isomerase [Photobacterium lucens]MZG81336.1 peptidyl-prolyl cis-trans isomerase [Photobacterium lucens]PSV21757.1 cyclophilin [Photobacterium leiognathi subsp. mandapamensis]
MIIFTTNVGDITIELNKQKAPVTAKNFLKYCQDGFYEGTIFHRVIKGFMIQGGGYTANMKEKPTRAPIVNEANRGLKNVIGSIAMARTDAPHSATAEFFINVADNDFLNHTATTNAGWGYAVFGQVTAGMDVVNKIAKVKTTSIRDYEDVPKEPIVIEKVTILD